MCQQSTYSIGEGRYLVQRENGLFTAKRSDGRLSAEAELNSANGPAIYSACTRRGTREFLALTSPNGDG